MVLPRLRLFEAALRTACVLFHFLSICFNYFKMTYEILSEDFRPIGRNSVANFSSKSKAANVGFEVFRPVTMKIVVL
jgi:hypothetical protein